MCLVLSPISNHHFHKAGQGLPCYNSNFGWWILVQSNSPKFVLESSFQFLPLILMYGSMRRLLKPNSPWKPPRLLEGRCSILRRLSRSEEEESPSAPSGFMMGDTHCPGPVTSGQGAEDYLARAGLGKWGGQLGLGVSSLAMYCEPTNWKLYHFHSQSSSVTELAFHLKLVQSTGIGFGCQRPYAFYCHFCYLVPNFAPVQLSFSKKSSHYISKPSFKYFIPQNWVALKSMKVSLKGTDRNQRHQTPVPSIELPGLILGSSFTPKAPDWPVWVSQMLYGCLGGVTMVHCNLL